MGKTAKLKPVISCPDWVDELGELEWNRLVAEGVLVPTVDNYTHLTAYCQSFARWRAAEEHISKHGVEITVLDDDGNVKFSGPSPHVAISNKYHDRMLKSALTLGINTERPGVAKATQPVRPDKTANRNFFGKFPTLN